MNPRTTLLGALSLLGALGAGCQSRTETDCPGMTEPRALVVDRPCAKSVVADEEHIYWAEPCQHRILRASRRDGRLRVLVDWALQPEALALDEDYLYFTTLGSGSSTDRTIARVPKEGGPVTVLATEQQLPFRLALHDDRVYWVNLFDQAPLMSAPKDGSAPAEVVAMSGGNAWDLAVDDSGVYWVEGSIEDGGGAVLHCPAGGCESGPTAIAADQPLAIAVVLDEERLYWARNGGVIVSMPRSQPAAPTEMHTSTRGGIDALVLLGDALVWSEGDAILTMPRDGGAVSTLVEGPPNRAFANTLSVQGSCLFYTTFEGQGVFETGLP